MEFINRVKSNVWQFSWSSNTENAPRSGRNKREFSSLLRQLGLDPNEKLTVMYATAVDKYAFSDESIQAPNEIPRYIVNRLMIADYGARAFTCNTENDSSDDDDDHDDQDDDDDDVKTDAINPMDAFLALIHCSDDFLRQDLANKLSTCQLSVPFLLPHPDRPSENITMLLWALEGIKKMWKATNDETGLLSDRDAFVTRYPFPIVSFIRVGNHEISKSRLLNEVMSDIDINGYHNFFFHRDCEGGGIKREIVDGLVELCWYLPGGKERQAFDREICFANLRGDAQIFRKQFALLSKISSVILILVPFESLDSTTKTFLCDATDGDRRVVYIFHKRRDSGTRRIFNELKSTRNFVTVIKERQENNQAFVKTIRSQIMKKLNNVDSNQLKKLEDLSDCANECGIVVDRQMDEWKKPIEYSMQAKDCFQGSSPQSAKRLFKLQQHVREIANLTKETFRHTRRGNREVQAYNNHLHQLMKEERKKQLSALNDVAGKVQACLSFHSSMSDTQRNFFVTCLKHDMDDMSLRVLPPLKERYKQVWKIISDNKDDENSKAELKQLEVDIAGSLFGLEHVVREMTQIYEVTQANEDYAKIAAQLLLSGRPLELMDGDSLNVSLKWLHAVFDELKRCIGDARIFVISALGIQSSGKSTMLNTMFGSQFAVSAGRCTRGAFASLIPLSDSLKLKSKYEYLLIVDTEGLSGSAEQQTREHDNELATFAIGVADLTIVNIFGENHNDIREFLEIAVHSFLKMKIVEEKRMCQIIHQNVAATNASNQLVSNRIALMNELNEMTKLAAIEEKCESECREFNDVIVFDQDKDVSYIPGMLLGCPPMAPVSPEYGKSIHKVKEKIIALICSPDRVPVSISMFQQRVKILWEAILKEDFIFSFRNTKEVRAKTSLDQKFFIESVKKIACGMTLLENDIISALRICKPEDRRTLWQQKKRDITVKAEAVATTMKDEMVQFFNSSEDRTTLEKWRESTLNKIDQLKRSRAEVVENNCKTVYDHLQNRQEIDKNKLVYKKRLLEKVKDRIRSVEDGEDESVYELIFEEFWNECIDDLPKITVERVNVTQMMEECLIRTNDRLTGKMLARYELKGSNIRVCGQSVPEITIEILQISWWINTKEQSSFPNPQLVLDDARIIRDQAVSFALTFAEETKLAGARCRQADLERMYHIVVNEIEEGLKDKKFGFSDDLACDILLYCFGRAYPIFEEMEDNYCRENNLRLYLEETLKPGVRNYFLDQCLKIKSEISAASSFVEVLKRAVQSKLNQTMGAAVADALLNLSVFQSKANFHTKVLVEIARENQFDSYKSYLANPVNFLKQRLESSIEYYCTASPTSPMANLYQSEVNKIKSSVFLAFQSIDMDKCTGLMVWIDKFIDQCTMLTFTKDMFDIVTIHSDLKDFVVFREKVEELLLTYFRTMLDYRVDDTAMSSWQPKPYDVLVNYMFGCDKCCPFCKAPCDQTVKNHAGKHSSKNHRPQGIVGWHNTKTLVLVTSICTTDVAGEGKFRNSDTANEYHPYKQYQTVNDYYKSWSITQDTSFEASSYWKWFMAKYPGELAKHFEVAKPEIPPNWKSITREEALKNIEAQYNMWLDLYSKT